VALGITNSIAANGETAITANLPMGGFKHTSVADAVLRNQYASAGQVQDSTLQWGSTAGGTADVLAITLAPVVTAYVTGQKFPFISSASPNATATPTLAVNGLAAKTLIHKDGTALIAGDIAASTLYEVVYDGTNMRINTAGARGASNAASAGANGDITSLTALASINGGQIGGLRNRILNGALTYFQIGNATISSGSTGYAADMTYVSCQPGISCTFSQGDYGTALGPRGTRYNANVVFAGTGVAGSNFRFFIEDVTEFSADNFTLSCDISDTVAQTYTLTCRQHFGASGSVSVDTITTQALTSANLLLSKTFALPSIAGKTLGVGHHLEVIFSCGAANAHTTYISSIQLEQGTVATPFERRDLGDEFRRVQRYYEAGYASAFVLAAYLNRAYTAKGADFKATKRIAPALTMTSVTTPTITSVSDFAAGTVYAVSVPPATDVTGITGYLQTSTNMNTGSAVLYTYIADARLVP